MCTAKKSLAYIEILNGAYENIFDPNFMGLKLIVLTYFSPLGSPQSRRHNRRSEAYIRHQDKLLPWKRLFQRQFASITERSIYSIKRLTI